MVWILGYYTKLYTTQKLYLLEIIFLMMNQIWHRNLKENPSVKVVKELEAWTIKEQV